MFSPEMIKEAPDSPGVYLMRDAAGQVLYVGKAVSLRKRLHSYTRVDPGMGRGKTAIMLGKVTAVDTVLTRTEKEALILESGLIKQHRPRYNVILRDDKSYPHLKVTVAEEWPRLLMTRRVLKDGARYFGPYSSPAAMWETLRLLNSLFPLRRCKSKKFTSGRRACLNYQMGRCPGPCVGAITLDHYRERVDKVLAVLEGRKRELSKDLERRMHLAADQLHFEEAALLRDQARALKQTLEKQVVLSQSGEDQDIFGFARKEGQVAVALLLVREGALADKREFFLPEPVGRDAEVMAELLHRFYEPEGHPIPRQILLPFFPEGRGALVEWFSDKRGGVVQVLTPQRGDKKALLEMAEDNARQLLLARERSREGWEQLGAEIASHLRLANIPERVECLDISNFHGHEAVGSLVSFKEGVKEPGRYRHFKIRGQDTPDDYAMMREVLLRHLSRGAREEKLPDLLVLDGGKGQLGVARAVVDELGLTNSGLELVSIAKDKNGAGERLFRPGRKNPLSLAAHSPVLLFFMKIRDEAHRYGITHHRKLRSKKQLRSKLDAIVGVGPARKALLLKTFGSLARVVAATPYELASVPGIGPELAATIHTRLNSPA